MFEAERTPLPLPPSEGSAFHGTGRCKPCAWFWKADSCRHGYKCLYCHLCPQDEIKRRKRARTEKLHSKKGKDDTGQGKDIARKALMRRSQTAPLDTAQISTPT